MRQPKLAAVAAAAVAVAAAASARKAASNEAENYKIPGEDDKEDENKTWYKANNTELFLNWYEVSDSSPISKIYDENSVQLEYSIEEGSETGYFAPTNYDASDPSARDPFDEPYTPEYVTVTIRANLTKGMDNNLLKNILPKAYTVSKTVQIVH